MSYRRNRNDSTSTYRKPASDEARLRWNKYMRDYRHRNPDKVNQWRLNYAKKLLEAAQQNGGGKDE